MDLFLQKLFKLGAERLEGRLDGAVNRVVDLVRRLFDLTHVVVSDSRLSRRKSSDRNSAGQAADILEPSSVGKIDRIRIQDTVLFASGILNPPVLFDLSGAGFRFVQCPAENLI